MASGEPGRNGKYSFKEVFKFYKKKNRSTMEEILELLDETKDYVSLNFIKKNEIGIDWETNYGMPHPRQWLVHTFTAKPGLIYIRNPFNSVTERYWIARCLKDFTKKPSHLNIDSHKILNEDDDWWEYCQRECNKNDPKSVLEKLRWATLGYHYNWDTKEYREESRDEFPGDLNALCRDIGKVFGFQNFDAQAAIINMYHEDSCLHGHTDRSEINLNAPLFSFSFGQPALFLAGGMTLNEEPMRLIIKSGDIIIMSEESRLSFHGVPRIVISTEKQWNAKIEGNEKVLNSPVLEKELLSDVIKEEFWNPFDSYVSKSRINLNVRQVL